MFEIVPASNTLVIEPTKLKEIGVVGTIEDLSKEQPQLGRVVKIGARPYVEDDPTRGERIYPVDVKEGDVVAYRKYGEYKFLIAGKRYLFVRMEDVLGIIRKTGGGVVE